MISRQESPLLCCICPQVYHTTPTHSGAYSEGVGCQGTTLVTAQFYRTPKPITRFKTLTPSTSAFVF